MKCLNDFASRYRMLIGIETGLLSIVAVICPATSPALVKVALASPLAATGSVSAVNLKAILAAFLPLG
jgi:hypothetical protein